MAMYHSILSGLSNDARMLAATLITTKQDYLELKISHHVQKIIDELEDESKYIEVNP